MNIDQLAEIAPDVFNETPDEVRDSRVVIRDVDSMQEIGYLDSLTYDGDSEVVVAWAKRS